MTHMSCQTGGGGVYDDRNEWTLAWYWTQQCIEQTQPRSFGHSQEEAERVVAEARKEAQATIQEAKSTTQEEQNKKLAEVKAVSAFASTSCVFHSR